MKSPISKSDKNPEILLHSYQESLLRYLMYRIAIFLFFSRRPRSDAALVEDFLVKSGGASGLIGPWGVLLHDVHPHAE